MISFGVGTKFLNTDDDDKVKDMHAEALSQKGLVKYLEENSLSESETLHMYVSSAPCGNSVIKKWAKPTFGKEYSDLSEKDWPGKSE